MENVKVTVVGDGAVGKTYLLVAYTTNSFHSGYVPTVYDDYSSNMMVKGKPYNIRLYDTSGMEDYDRFRALSYPQTEVFLVCFAVDRPVSLENVKLKWIPELTHYCPHVPVLVVACKTDLRAGGSPARRTISYDEGNKVAKSVKASYCETSALTQAGVRECFEHAVDMATSLKPSLATSLEPSGASKSKGFAGFLFSRKKKQVPPVMPPADD